MGWKRQLFDLFVAGYSALSPKAAAMPCDPEAIFVLRNNDLGDVLVTTPLFQALRTRFPRARIVAGVGTWATPILVDNPYVDEVIPINAPWHNGKVRPRGVRAAIGYLSHSPEVERLRREQFQIGIDVLGSGFGSCLLLRGRIPWRLGVHGYAGGHTACQQSVAFDVREHVARSALRFAELLGATSLPEARPQIFLISPPPRTGDIVFAPGGGYAEKCWPVDHFVELARRLAPLKIVVIGGTEDREAAATICQAGNHVENVAGSRSLRETFAIIAGARLVVCNSSMAMHAAAAFRVRSVVLLGPALANDVAAHTDQWGYPESRIVGGPATVDAAAAAVAKCLVS